MSLVVDAHVGGDVGGVPGVKSRAVLKMFAALASSPPVIKTFPFGSAVAAWYPRGAGIGVVSSQTELTASNCSAVSVANVVSDVAPPATITAKFPDEIAVAV